MVKVIDWAAVLKRVRPEVHKKVMEARGRHEELRRLITEGKATMPQINFDQYRQALPATAHGFVNEMEAAMKQFHVKKVDPAPQLQALDTERSQKVPGPTYHAIINL